MKRIWFVIMILAVQTLAATSTGIQEKTTFETVYTTTTPINNNTTVNRTFVTQSFTNETTESTTPLIDPISKIERTSAYNNGVWELPGTPINETIAIYFKFTINATHIDGNNTVFFFANTFLTCWFIGYEFDAALSKAMPYQSKQTTFDPSKHSKCTLNVSGTDVGYRYNGSIRALFGSGLSNTFITATKIYYFSSIERDVATTKADKEYDAGEWKTNEWKGPTGVLQTWDNNKYKLHTSGLQTTIIYGSEKRIKVILPIVPNGVDHVVWHHSVSGAETKSSVADTVSLHGTIFQVYVPPGTSKMNVNITVGADTRIDSINPDGSKYYFITSPSTQGVSTVEKSLGGELRHSFIGDKNGAVAPQQYNYILGSAPGWRYITLFSACQITAEIDTEYEGAQHLDNTLVTNAIQDFNAFSLGTNLDKKWYATLELGNTTVGQTVTKIERYFTMWENRTKVYQYYNNSGGKYSYTIGDNTYKEGFWWLEDIVQTAPPVFTTTCTGRATDTEVAGIDFKDVEINPNYDYTVTTDAPGSTYWANWALKCVVHRYIRTIVAENTTLTNLTMTFISNYSVMLDYTEKTNAPVLMDKAAIEGKFVPRIDDLALTYSPQSLPRSHEFFVGWNKNETLDFVHPNFEDTQQGRYAKNVWVMAAPSPAVYGIYVWVPPKGKLTVYNHYDIITPWERNHTYTYNIQFSVSMNTDENVDLRADGEGYSYVAPQHTTYNGFMCFNTTTTVSLDIAIYRDNTAYDAEKHTFKQQQRFDVYEITPDRLKVYLKEDIWEAQRIVNAQIYPKTYKVYTYAPSGAYNYDEVGEKSEGTSLCGYPYIGIIFRCGDTMGSPQQATPLNETIVNNTANESGVALPSDILNATLVLPEIVFFNSSFNLLTLEASKTYPAYQFYSFEILPSETLKASGREQPTPIDAADALEIIKEEFNKSLSKQGSTIDNTNATAGITSSDLLSLNALAQEGQVLTARLISTNESVTIVKLQSWDIKEASIAGFFNATLLSDRVNVSFRDKDQWTSAEIENKLDTTAWFTFIEPMLSRLDVTIDNEDGTKGDTANVTIALLVGKDGSATIDGKLAAANQPVQITYIDEYGNRVTKTIYTNDKGISDTIQLKLPEGQFVFEAKYDINEKHIGSAEFSKKIGRINLGEWEQAIALLIVVGGFCMIFYVMFSVFRKNVLGAGERR